MQKIEFDYISFISNWIEKIYKFIFCDKMQFDLMQYFLFRCQSYKRNLISKMTKGCAFSKVGSSGPESVIW